MAEIVNLSSSYAIGVCVAGLVKYVVTVDVSWFAKLVVLLDSACLAAADRSAQPGGIVIQLW